MRRQASDEATNRFPGHVPAAPGREDEIGAPAFFGVGHLGAKDRRQLRCRHARPRQDARALNTRWRRDDGGRVADQPPALFEQQRHVEHHQRPARVAVQEPPLRLPHKWMHHRLEPPERHHVAEHRLSQLGAVEPLGVRRAGKQRLDRTKRPAARALERANDGIGIEHRHAERAKHRGHR